MLILNGDFSLICSKCGKQHDFNPDDSEFDLNYSDSDNQMGVRNGYAWEHSFECDICNNEIEIQYEVTEYPLNIFENEEVTISGGKEIRRFNIDFQEEPESDEF